MEKGKELYIRTNADIINCPAKSSKELKPIDVSNDFFKFKRKIYFDKKKNKKLNSDIK